MNVHDEHFIYAEVTIPSKQTTAFVAIADPMIAEHYADDTALARYRCTSGRDGRYEGLQTNVTIFNSSNSSAYGYYLTSAPGESNTNSLSPMFNTTTGSKAMLADANGNLKINAAVRNYLSAGTYIVEFMW